MRRTVNQRRKTKRLLILCALFLLLVIAAGCLYTDAASASDFSRKNLPPGRTCLFGTDWLGRDMLARTLKGLSVSLLIGALAAVSSALMALTLGTAAAVMGKAADAVISYMIDLLMGIPHMLLLILISFAVGKGSKGVILGIALTHWPAMTRVIRGEILQLKESQYIRIAKQLGHGRLHIAVKHMLPHVLPQFMTGLALLFPHVILHEAGITFLGFGLSAGEPALGIILSESMRYLITGKWWLAVFPGALLAATVLLFDVAGESLRKLMDPASVHR